jgi:hypothetical protein
VPAQLVAPREELSSVSKQVSIIMAPTSSVGVTVAAFTAGYSCQKGMCLLLLGQLSGLRKITTWQPSETFSFYERLQFEI